MALPGGYEVREEAEDAATGTCADPERTALAEWQQQFWTELLAQLRLDDPEQQVATPARQGYLKFLLPAPAGSSFLSVYRNLKRNEVGVWLSSTRSSAGEYAM